MEMHKGDFPSRYILIMNSVSTHSLNSTKKKMPNCLLVQLAAAELLQAKSWPITFAQTSWAVQVVEPCWVAPFLDFYLEYHWIPPAPSLRRVWIFLGAQQEWAAAALAAPSATAGEFNARHPSTLHTLRRKRADLGKKSTFSREFTQNMSDRDKPR